MADKTDIQKAFNLVLGAGLDYTPSQDEIKTRAFSWIELLEDVPGDCLIQAARDIANSGERFPSVAAIRRQAAGIKSRNGKGTQSQFGPGFFRPQRDMSPSVMVVLKDHWQPWTPGSIELVEFPPAYLEECARLEALDRLPTDEEFAFLESLRGK